MLQPSEPLYTVADIRALEAQCHADADPPLMERAGHAAATHALELIAQRPGPVLIACGPGNNGGDGLVMARHLLQAGRAVTVVLASDPDTLPADARAAFAAWHAAGGTTLDTLPPSSDEGWALIVDALFGIGLQRPVDKEYAHWIERLNGDPAPCLALDLPSGLDADTGCALGPTIRASHTLSFIAHKPGLLTRHGPDHAGRLAVHTLGLTPEHLLEPSGRTVTPALFRAHLRPRLQDSHKGRYGTVGVIGGAPGMAGAALLSARAALKLGAGRVLAGLLDDDAPSVDLHHPELMLRSPHTVLEEASALVIGPGMGTSGTARRLLAHALVSACPLLLDADALNLLAADPARSAACAHRPGPLLLTPHPGEAARLLATDTATIQRDRVAAALTLAQRWNAGIVLKGCGSVIALPDGRWFINSSGHAGMASAGMGDTLCGFIAALLAQGWPAEAALMGGVHLHGAAAEELAHTGIGPIGLTASEVIDAGRRVLNLWIRQTLISQ